LFVHRCGSLNRFAPMGVNGAGVAPVLPLIQGVYLLMSLSKLRVYMIGVKQEQILCY